MKVKIYVNNQLLDLFKDESVNYTTKLSDIEKLSNVFNDFTDSFTVPATPNNNLIFKHYFDVDIDNTFNANIRVNGYIEIDDLPFRVGKIQLEGVKLKSNIIDSYKITFYGSVIQLTELFGEDTIDKLDYVKVDNTYVKTYSGLSQFDFAYEGGNIIQTISNPAFLNGHIITPLISYTDRDCHYGTGDSTDISTNSGAIVENELRPAIRVIKLFEAIETKYNILFDKTFLNTGAISNLFMWLNGNTNEFNLGQEVPLDIINDFSYGDSPYPGWVDTNYQFLDLTNNYFQMNIPALGSTDFEKIEFWNRIMIYDLSDVDTTFKVIVRDYDTNEIVAESDERTGNDTTSDTSIFIKFFQRNINYSRRLKYSIRTSKNSTFKFRIIANMFITPIVGGPAYTDRVGNSLPNTQSVTSIFNIGDNLPKMKVIDFIQGLMKMFKMIIRPITQNTFYIDTLNNYYLKGKTINISQYINNDEISIDRPVIYKTISFNYQKTENVLGATFRRNNDPNDKIGYGDLSYKYDEIDSKDELKVELPFENMMFERLSVQQPSLNAGNTTNIIIGQSISKNTDNTYSRNSSKPILFYDNGLSNNVDFPFKFKFGAVITTVYYCHIINNSDNEILGQVNNSINWGSEIDPWNLTDLDKSLYLNYWSKWISTIYSLKQRKFTYDAILPTRIINDISLNTTLIIGNHKYKINDYKIDLTNGKTKFTLFNDIGLWDYVTPPKEYNYGSNIFTPSTSFTTDYIDNGNSTYVYGSFTGYNGSNYGRIIKVLKNGSVDSTFNSGSGFNSNSYRFNSIKKQSNGKLIVGGDFTSYSGVSRNRIIRLNTDGSIDNTFTVGTGFNNVTSGIDIDSNGKIIVTGPYSQYSGVSRNRIVRLNTDGSFDTTFTGLTSGFDNSTFAVVVNDDNSMYVSGNFSTYNGVSSNRLVKLNSFGDIDTSFNIGTGFTGSNMGIEKGENGSVYVYGNFTTYSGTTGTTTQNSNRLIKLLPNGQLDPNFYTFSGFSTEIVKVKKLYDDNLLVKFNTQTNYYGNSSVTMILNKNGQVLRTLPTENSMYYAIEDRYYWGLTNGVNIYTKFNLLDSNYIEFNASSTYYDFPDRNIISLEKVNLGYGVDWITIVSTINDTTPHTNITIKVGEKASSVVVPDVYLPRYMFLRYTTNQNYTGLILIKQNGIQEV